MKIIYLKLYCNGENVEFFRKNQKMIRRILCKIGLGDWIVNYIYWYSGKDLQFKK